MSRLLEQLNPPQREAVEWAGGPLLILAGAGSGKTRVITYRVAYLVEARGVAPERILAVTFTNKAADQMKERVARLLEGGLSTWPHISTFHSFCASVLRRHIDRLGYTRDFSIYDEDDQQKVIKSCVQELGLGDQITSPRSVLGRISFAKNSGLTPEELYAQAEDAPTERLASLFERYERKLRQANALDFDDLLLKTVELFYSDADVCEKWNERFEHILVDEYQDTNRIQYQLIRQLTLQRQNLCAVGDEDQSIYRWRGADIGNILNFEKDYPNTHIIRLEQNYRSTQTILDAATAVVSRNLARKGKKLWTDRAGGARVGLYEAADAEDEAMFVAGQIATALDADPSATVAVLYRTNAQSRLMEEAMRRQGIEYRLVGGFSFYARAEIRDVLAYARLALNLKDSAALLRIINVPARGIGETTVAALEQSARRRDLSLWEALEQELAAQLLSPRALKALEAFHRIIEELVAERESLSPSEFLRSVVDRTGYRAMLEADRFPESEDRLENLMELINAAAEAEERGETLAEFLAHAALVSDADAFDERARVTLMTLHSAKGLEFSTVFLAGLEEGLIPHKLSLDDGGVEEERRLCYVGMTRARDRLVLSWARERRSFAREGFEGSRPSRFLREVPDELIEPLNLAFSGAKPRTSWDNALNSPESVEQFFGSRRASALGHETGRPPGRWKLGTLVRHPKFGLGTVVECEGEGEDAKLTVSFPGRGRMKLVERYAALEKA
jgi:DNA helicase-2/ATP-dependent DNA helicase PcrA